LRGCKPREIRHGTKGIAIKKHFTLFELLVIIVIIVVVAAIVIPGVRKSREDARRINCAGNLKSLGLCLRMYAGDNQNVYPDGTGCCDDSTGMNLLVQQGYMSAVKVFLCPSTTTTTVSHLYISTRAFTYRYDSGHTVPDADKHVSLMRDHETNHRQFGNIVFGDGHVKGYSGANWLNNSNF